MVTGFEAGLQAMTSEPSCRRPPLRVLQGIAGWRGLRLAALCLALLGALSCAGLAADAAHAEGTAPVQADRVLVLKGERRLMLLRDGQAFASFWIALGSEPIGPKERRGDGRTPEGTYTIDRRTRATSFHGLLHISYPDASDRARAARLGVPPGGGIGIHGLPAGWGPKGPGRPMIDWTNGCIAITNHDLDLIWDSVPDGTPIEIRP